MQGRSILIDHTGRKYDGFKRHEFLFVRKGIDLSPYADGGAQEFGKRAGTENVASIVGMVTALKANCEAIHENEAQLQMLERELLDRLDAARIVYTRNGGANTLPGLMSLSFPGKSGEAILHRLDLMGISISTGSACDSKNTEISHVLKAIKLDEELALGTIRISLGKYNTQEEASHIADALIKVMKQ